MTPEESLELLREAHREPLDEPHFAAVRANVMAQIAAGRRAAPRVWWFSFVGVVAAVLVASLWVKGPAPSRVARRAPKAPNAVKTLAASAPVSVDNQVLSSHERAERKPGGRPKGLAPQSIVGPRVSQPLVVKMVTDDPDVVIYWITEGIGE